MNTFRKLDGRGCLKHFFKSQTAEAAQPPRIILNWTLIYIPAVQKLLIKEIWFILLQKQNQPTSSFNPQQFCLFMHSIHVTNAALP